MEIIVILISISLLIALVFLGIFFWNVKSGQYEDTYSPSVRILFEDSDVTKNEVEDEKETAQDKT